MGKVCSESRLTLHLLELFCLFFMLYLMVSWSPLSDPSEVHNRTWPKGLLGAPIGVLWGSTLKVTSKGSLSLWRFSPVSIQSISWLHLDGYVNFSVNSGEFPIIRGSDLGPFPVCDWDQSESKDHLIHHLWYLFGPFCNPLLMGMLIFWFEVHVFSS